MAVLTSCLGDTITLLLIAFGVFYLYAKHKLSYWRRRGVPSLLTDLIFGNFKDAILMRASPGMVMSWIHKEADDDTPFVGFYILQKACLLVRSPELIKQILVKDFNVFPNRYFAGAANRAIDKGLFSINNPHWKYLRTKLSPIFTSGKLKKMFPLIVESGDSMVRYLQRKTTKRTGDVGPIDVKETSAKYTNDVISSLAFGIRTNSFETPEPEFRIRARETFKTSIRSAIEFMVLFFYPWLVTPLRLSPLGRYHKFFHDLFWDSVNAHEQSGVKRGDLIDALVDLKNVEQESDFKFAGDCLLAQSAVFFVAGFETSSTTMAFALLELASHPEMQERARREILYQIDKHGGMTYEASQEMKYLVQVISETLRLYPPAPIIDRTPVQDYQIPGTDLVIEKDTPVYMTLNGLHEDPKYHREPKRFDPERFSDERKHEIIPFTYMPFGEGPRICIGMRIGMLQTIVGLAMILRDYEIILNPEYENVVNPMAVFTSPKNGVNVNLKKIITQLPS